MTTKNEVLKKLIDEIKSTAKERERRLADIQTNLNFVIDLKDDLFLKRGSLIRAIICNKERIEELKAMMFTKEVK